MGRILQRSLAAPHDCEDVRRSNFMDLPAALARFRLQPVAMELADLPGHPARAIASRHKSLIEARLAEAFARGKIAAPAVTAREIWLLSEGAMMCMVLHGNPQYVTTAKRAALRLMRSSVRRVSRHPTKTVGSRKN